ncbi:MULTISPECIES: pyridoxamine 5'-phosphate oxidase family protein [Paenibacillus]|uniref:Phosphohydrolase n=1 Tax=Paenibacillus odorifer TaxID=189426 RepID=A0A1R0X641_9BACL|nr:MULTISPECIES: pyridoxamine 5'-phosphate oxidase family protein [Paenibacillus]AIQ73875.1 phosphohydrolase [Paenibacillus odorifer]ETT49282.1 pyridoxamine 5'-phosphate oxidase-like FMN-binding protein [Paenibacillus sp. FSL H8-237]OMC99766.1 phosphohydrolase [Paenibacillus odorifer]OMD22660.1 phosphohydrolase [Paenibacillus odorifer]OMD30087.1 phosphohydrolase [Paenibacillus odorifer]
MKPNFFEKVIESEEELRSLFGYPSELVNNKTITFIDHHCRDYISKSPMLFMATSGSSGACDVSPRGDAEGFVHVLDDKHLVIPERPGNRRFDSLRNILENPKVGLIFIIPGLEETLRINGHASIVKDEEILKPMEAHGKVPVIGIGVEVEECYMHCAKAFKRSHLWDDDYWLAKEVLPNPSKILAQHARKLGVTPEDISKSLKESYEKRLY